MKRGGLVPVGSPDGLYRKNVTPRVYSVKGETRSRTLSPSAVAPATGRRSARARTRGPAELPIVETMERNCKNCKTITLNGGSLGSWVDEERS